MLQDSTQGNLGRRMPQREEEAVESLAAMEESQER
jgi:hypothetical protein